MGQPVINISFKTSAQTTVSASGSGTVGLILSDETKETEVSFYKKYTYVDKQDYTSKNLEYINLAFMGNPKQVVVIRTANIPDYDTALKICVQKNIDFLAIPSLLDESKPSVIQALKSYSNEGITITTFLANAQADCENIVNFTSENILTNISNDPYSAQEYTARLAGYFAGLGLDQSGTYKTFSEIKSFDECIDPDKAAENGELIFLNDGEKIKLGRAVTSLTTIEGKKSNSMQKIKIVTAMHMIIDDIKKAFNDYYIGMNNSYDNKLVFINEIRAYFKTLTRLGVLDDTYEHTVDFDINIIRDHLGDSVSEMTDDEVKRQNTGSFIYLLANVKFSDAIEDLQFTIYM